MILCDGANFSLRVCCDSTLVEENRKTIASSSKIGHRAPPQPSCYSDMHTPILIHTVYF
jgi:hypothetical protein